jgi:hypothetical protein
MTAPPPFRRDPFPFVIGIIALLSSGRVWLLQDGIWDDNTWLFSIYSTSTLREFLDTGFSELRREPLGAFFYYFMSLHKTTGWFYPILHFTNLATQILCPITLYHLIKNLFCDRPRIAIFVALSLVTFPLNHTLPYISALNYRIGMTLSLLSLLSTERALTTERFKSLYLSLALLSAGLSQYVFLESTVAFEPARLLIIWLILSRSACPFPFSLVAPLLRWLPFVLLTLPLVYHKLRYRPYGMYASGYPTDPLFFLNIRYVLNNLLAIITVERRELAHAITLENAWAIALWLCATGILFFVFRKMLSRNRSNEPIVHSRGLDAFKAVLDQDRFASRNMILLGITFFIPPALLFMYTHLPFVGEQHNTHASLIQLGAACIFGTVFYLLYRLSSYLKRTFLVGLSLALLLGEGVFDNNKYLDLYRHSWEEQSRFLNAFLDRFPGLPDRAIFLVDVQTSALFSDLRNPIDFEFPLNLLYATTPGPADFRRYLAITLEDYRTLPPNQTVIARQTHWGTETLKTDEVIVVWYRNGELLINREILQRDPDIEYKAWLDRDFPKLPPPSQYVFREKMRMPPRN